MNSSASAPVFVDDPISLFAKTPGKTPQYFPLSSGDSLQIVLGEPFSTDFSEETQSTREKILSSYTSNSPLFHVEALTVSAGVNSLRLQTGVDFVGMLIAQNSEDVKALLPSVLAANIFLRTPDGRYVVFPRGETEVYKALAGLVVASEESGVPTLIQIIRQRLETEKIGGVGIDPKTAKVRGLLFYPEKREAVIDIEMPISDAVFAAIQGIKEKVLILTEDEILSGKVPTLPVTSLLIRANK